MKKLFLSVMIILPMMLSAQNVTVSNLVVTEGSPTTVTFNVSWNRPADPAAVWMDSAWVFVDYNKNGVMTRLPLLLGSGATLTYTSAPGEGRVEEVPGNDKGMWVRGYARTNWSFSATVQLLTATADLYGACAYASGYPPVGAWIDETALEFTGTPRYEVTLTSDTDGSTITVTSGDKFFLPCSYTVSSFTDATGAPGVFNCLPSVDIYDLTASATAFCAGDAVTFALSNTTAGRTYQLYKDGVAVDALTGTGSAEIFTGAFAGAGTYTARVDAKGIYCAAQMTGTHVIAENTPPSAPANLVSNVMTICDGTSTSATLTASANVGSGAVYEWGTGSTVGDNSLTTTAGNTCSVSLSEATTCWVRLKGAGACSAVTTGGVTVSIAANTPPSAPTGLSPNVATICDGRSTNITLTATADVGAGAVYEWGTGGTVGDNPITTTTANTRSVTTSTAATYWVRLKGTGACSATVTGGTTTAITANTPPSEAPTGLSSDITSICNGTSTTMTLTATGGDMGSGAVYEWGRGNTVGGSMLSPSTTTANTYLVAPTAATTYWVRLRGAGACSATTTGGIRTGIAVYSAVSPGTITSATVSTIEGTNPNVTTESTAAATGGSPNLTYEWRRTGTSSATLTGSNAATYTIGSDVSNYSTAGTYRFNRYVKDATCNTSWVVASGTFTLLVTVSCDLPQPDNVGTFANFNPANYSASTTVRLTDTRDNKEYVVVKIGTRWIMAQNLNYQTGLTWQPNSNSPSTVYGSDTDLIGHFWCPAGGMVSLSNRESCDMWGALYSWETAMSFDGKGSWTENTTYNTGAANASGSQFNHGRTASGSGTGGRGICPTNWHVPTDNEWGIILDGMESSGGTAHQNASSATYSGVNAGTHGKSKCMCPVANTLCDTDTEIGWQLGVQGTDSYGLRVLPAGYRRNDGIHFNYRGSQAYLWSSSARDASIAWIRHFSYNQAKVNRSYAIRSSGFSIRCIRNL